MSLKLIKTLCETDTDDLEVLLFDFLAKNYAKVISKDGYYMFAEGNIPVCLIAHIDTVFDTYRNFVFDNPKWFFDADKNVLWKPYGSGFDDRAGIYSIIKLINAGFRPHVIFTIGEEIGGIGAQKIIEDYSKMPFDSCNFLIQIDRRGSNDAVFYQCNNEKFIDYITSFDFVVAKGTYTDISFIAPAWGIAAVNVSCGYYEEHTESEYLNIIECNATIEKIKMILEDNKKSKPFYYIPVDIFHMTKQDTVIGF